MSTKLGTGCCSTDASAAVDAAESGDGKVPSARAGPDANKQATIAQAVGRRDARRMSTMLSCCITDKGPPRAQWTFFGFETALKDPEPAAGAKATRSELS